MPLLSCRFQFPVARLYTHSHLFVTLCIYQLHHSSTSFHFINYSVLHFDHLNDRHSFSQSPSSNCVHYKVYFILHFIIYFYLYSFFIIYVLMIWLNPLPVSVYFLVLPHFPNIQSPSFFPSIPSVLVCLHSLSFFSPSHAFVTGTPVSHSTLQSNPSVSGQVDISFTRMFFQTPI